MSKVLSKEEGEILKSNIDFIVSNIVNGLTFTRDVNGQIYAGSGVMQANLYILPFEVCDIFMSKGTREEIIKYNESVTTTEEDDEYLEGLNEIITKWKVDNQKLIYNKVIDTIKLYDLTDELSMQMNIDMDIEKFEEACKNNII